MSDSIEQVASGSSDARRRRLSLLGLVLGHTIAAGLAIWPFTIGFSDYAWPRGEAIFIEALACGQLSVAVVMVAAEWPALSIRIGSLAGGLAFWLLALNPTLTEELWPKIFA